MEVNTLRQNGAVINTTSATSYFDLNAPSPVGAIYSDSSYEVITMQGVLPVTSTVGMQGVGWTSVTYASSSKLTKTTDSTLNWSLDADTATTAWLCGNSVDRNTDGFTDSGSECYKINTSGQILGGKATVVVQGVTLTFQ